MTDNEKLMLEYAREREEKIKELLARKERDKARRKSRKNRHVWANLKEQDSE